LKGKFKLSDVIYIINRLDVTLVYIVVVIDFPKTMLGEELLHQRRLFRAWYFRGG
jgi:hypothetical protein